MSAAARNARAAEVGRRAQRTPHVQIRKNWPKAMYRSRTMGRPLSTEIANPKAQGNSASRSRCRAPGPPRHHAHPRIAASASSHGSGVPTFSSAPAAHCTRDSPSAGSDGAGIQ